MYRLSSNHQRIGTVEKRLPIRFSKTDIVC